MTDGDGPKVVIMRHECALLKGRKEKPKYKLHVDHDKCIGEACGCDNLCTRVFLCPGLIWDKKTGKTKIDEVICTGCGVCADICPQGAIIKEVA
jgi:indolepyruvate ferredoxin oxidoreductase alpha subunit